MKFNEMPYVRPDLAAFQAKAEATAQKIAQASSAQEQIEAILAFDQVQAEINTAMSLAYVRHTIDTRDEFYDQENDYADEIAPAVQEAEQKVSKALLASPFRAELAERFGKILFTNLEIAVRTFDPKNMALMQEENKLQSEYQKLYASAMVEWNGEKLPLPKLGPYKQSPDRSVRKAAYEAEGKWFDSHQAELDELYDKLVKNRTAQAKNMGYDNYLQLGYDRLGRNCYGPVQVASFRDQIAQDMVPIVAKVKKDQEKRLGVEKLKFWDDVLLFPDGNADPQGTADEILAAGKQMYHELSPETAEFADFLWDNELLDVLSKEGKAPGGYQRRCGRTDPRGWPRFCWFPRHAQGLPGFHDQPHHRGLRGPLHVHGVSDCPLA